MHVILKHLKVVSLFNGFNVVQRVQRIPSLLDFVYERSKCHIRELRKLKDLEGKLMYQYTNSNKKNNKSMLQQLSKKLGTGGKIGICWTFVTFGGLYAFYLSKNHIDKQRSHLMQVRERIRRANEQEYDKSEPRFN